MYFRQWDWSCMKAFQPFQPASLSWCAVTLMRIRALSRFKFETLCV